MELLLLTLITHQGVNISPLIIHIGKTSHSGADIEFVRDFFKDALNQTCIKITDEERLVMNEIMDNGIDWSEVSIKIQDYILKAFGA